MAKKKIPERKLKFARMYDKISGAVTRVAGSPIASILSFFIIIVWAVTGPLFQFSDTWQLVINTGTTIITFLMVFVIQQTQNKDSVALQMKLNELIACNDKASNRLIAIEDLTEDELIIIKKFYSKLSKLAEKENELHTSHSLDEADDVQEEKSTKRKKENAKDAGK